jgi:hypothetical protein
MLGYTIIPIVLRIDNYGYQISTVLVWCTDFKSIKLKPLIFTVYHRTTEYKFETLLLAILDCLIRDTDYDSIMSTAVVSFHSLTAFDNI